jgi:uncharacterized protein
MTRYFVDLKDLADEKISLQGSLAPGDIDFSRDGVVQFAPIDWVASVQRVGSEIRINGSITTTMDMTCSRCLELARHDINKVFDLFFRERHERMFDEDAEVELTEEETQTAFFTGTQLAIGEILREQVLLALPMKALCRVDCKGLCPTCGINLNSGACKCPAEEFSPRMDMLELKKRLEQRSS